MPSSLKPASCLWCGLALALLGAGCNPAPSYRRPEVAPPVGFKEAVPADARPGAGWKLAQPGDERPKGPWWEAYGDPQLNALEIQVAVSNQGVIQAEASYRQARALVDLARASLFPTISTSPSVTRSRSSQGLVSGGGGAVTTTDGSGQATTAPVAGGGNGSGLTRTVYNFPVDASYEVDLWHRVRNTMAQNRYAAEASAADVATAILSMQTDLAQDYFQLRALDEQRRLLDETLQDYRGNLKLVNTLFQQGLASNEDIAQANSQLETSDAQATDLGISRAQLEHAIAVLVGRAPAQFSLVPAPFDPRLPAMPVALPSELLERRPDIASAERQVAAANAGIGIARAAYYPTLSLSASGGFESTSLKDWFDWPNRFWSLGPALAETLFDGGARKANHAKARAAYEETVAGYRQAVLAAFQAVEDSLATLRVLDVEAGQQHGAVTAAEATVHLSLVRFKNGIDSYLNVVTAQNAYLTAREGELQVQSRQLTATVTLIKALGGGWDTSQLGATERLAEHPTAPPPPPEKNTPVLPANPPPLPKASGVPENMRPYLSAGEVGAPAR
jgi:NodT family efflux transporter outer membrane factor (OMF) lipoprotein